MLTPALARADASFLLPQNPVCRLRKIFRDKVGLRRPLRRVPGEFTFAVACAHKNTSRAGVSRQFHVTITITNDEGPLHIEPVLPRCALQHAGFWLAAATVFRGSVRTIINCVDLRARLG